VTRVPIEIGPVPTALVAPWIANSRAIVDGVRRHVSELSIEVRGELLDLCEALLDVMEGTAAKSGPTFHWTADVEAEPLGRVAWQWLEIGALTDAELELIGCSWAPAETRPVSDAVAWGVLRALELAGETGRPLAEELRSRRNDPVEAAVAS